MRINGGWFLGADEVSRPVIWAQILTRPGSWMAAPFLVDTGADRMVFSAGVLATLQLPSLVAQERLGGVGGIVSSVLVDAQVRFLVYGRYHFNIEEARRRKGLRPLRQSGVTIP